MTIDCIIPKPLFEDSLFDVKPATFFCFEDTPQDVYVELPTVVSGMDHSGESEAFMKSLEKTLNTLDGTYTEVHFCVHIRSGAIRIFDSRRDHNKVHILTQDEISLRVALKMPAKEVH